MILNKLFRIRLLLIMIGCFSLMNLSGQNLKKHEWENRVLIVKTAALKSKIYQEQLKEFENSLEELIDRKFIMYKIVVDDFMFIDFKDSALNNSGKLSGKRIKKILSANESFEVILIGLDGGVKLKQKVLLIKEDLFKIIDSMPMRRNELIRNEIKK